VVEYIKRQEADMPDDEKVKLFVSGGCGPCQAVKQMVAEGRFNLDDVEIIDVTTEEGFPWIKKLGLQKVPTAMKGAKVCKLLIDGETLVIDCDGEHETKESQ
jgi:thiol-disulfide isomerase/thioredoxin